MSSIFTVSYDIAHSQSMTPITYMQFATHAEALAYVTETFGVNGQSGANEYTWSDDYGRSGYVLIHEHVEGSAEWCKYEQKRLDAVEEEVVTRAWDCHNSAIALLQAVLGATVISKVVTA